jgi:hypothetical protein
MVTGLQPYERPEVIAYSELLTSSFARLTGRALLEPSPDLARRLYEAPFALVSHGVETDPIFCYANSLALNLWKMPWEEFTSTPSRLCVEATLQKERDRLLAEARGKGCVKGYEGVRIAKDGQRFLIQDTVLWNVDDPHGVRRGQACVIRKWKRLTAS